MASPKHKYPLPQQSQANQAIQHQEGKKELAQEVIGIVQQSFSGPIPPPNILAEYSKIIPNGAERIMIMAEEQSKHRRELEKKVIETDSRNSFLGVIFAFVLGMTTIITGGIVVIKGYTWPGTVLGSAGLVGLVSTFIYGTRERRKERESKAIK
jgi:uncharacterized membrane protein